MENAGEIYPITEKIVKKEELHSMEGMLCHKFALGNYAGNQNRRYRIPGSKLLHIIKRYMPICDRLRLAVTYGKGENKKLTIRNEYVK